MLYSVPVYTFSISFSISVLFSQKTHVNLVDRVKSFLASIHYLLAKIGVDTAESEPSKVSNIIPTQANKFYICIGRCHGKR